MANYPNGRYISYNSARQIGGSFAGYEAYFNWGNNCRMNRYINPNWSEIVGDLPSGYGIGGGTVVPAIIAGGISSYQGEAITVTQTGTTINGMTLVGPGDFSFVTNGSLNVTIQLNANGTLTWTQTGSIKMTTGLSGTGTWSITGTGLLAMIVPFAGSSQIIWTDVANLKGRLSLSGDITPYTELSPQSLAAAVWNSVASEFDESGTMGQKLNAAGTAGDPWTQALPGAYAPGTAGYILGTSSGLTPEQIADAVWDEVISGHTTAGTTGKALADAGSAGNPWSTLVSGNTSSGTFGELVDKKLLKTGTFIALK